MLARLRHVDDLSRDMFTSCPLTGDIQPGHATESDFIRSISTPLTDAGYSSTTGYSLFGGGYCFLRPALIDWPHPIYVLPRLDADTRREAASNARLMPISANLRVFFFRG